MYATVEDVEARWRTLSPTEKVTAAVLLEDAAVQIDAACPPGEELTDRELASRKIVSCGMVKRAMLAGQGDAAFGVTSIQQGAGPYQETRQFSNPMGDLYLTKAERRLLGCGAQGAFTIGLVDYDEPGVPAL